MRIELLTLFPEMCDRVLNESIIGRALRAGKLELHSRNFRDYSVEKHNRVDDTVYGGGKGMLLKAEPIYQCCKAVEAQWGVKPHVIYMSPHGKVFDQQKAIELSKMDNLLFLCGHYEGVDQRVLDEVVDEEISLGDFVLTGGELAALAVVDAVCRLCDGVLSEEVCFTEESHYNGLLEYPHYTRPAVWMGREVPEVLQNGHHGKIDRWRREQSLIATYQKRPDMLATAPLTKEDKLFLQMLKNSQTAQREEGEAE